MTVAARLRGHRSKDAAISVVAAPEVAVGAPTGPYVGLLTRALAFGVDAAIINAAALIAAAVVALTFNVLTLPDWLRTVAVATGAAAYALWSVGYFVTFWSTTGQTPGNRLLRLEVRAAGGGRLLPRRALVRFLGLILGALPLFGGYLMILVENRRRGLHDVLARTVVVDAEREDLGASRRTGRRTEARG
jgi:uncharacterized RDD family membrane protein YckC